jgi:hypothetical protein
MIEFLKELLDWSEVWATLIPLTVYFVWKPKARWLKPVLLYLAVALLLNLVIDFTWKAKNLGLGDWSKKIFWWLYVNVKGKPDLYTLIFYNLNSCIRLLCFSWFFYLVNPAYRKIYKFITTFFISGIAVNFIFYEDIFLSFSSRLHTIEAAILLFYCLLYYYAVNMDEEIPSPLALPPFWTVMGLTLYTSVNFLIFLFYNYLIGAEKNYAIEVWNVHNLIYIVLMITIAVAVKKIK